MFTIKRGTELEYSPTVRLQQMLACLIQSLTESNKLSTTERKYGFNRLQKKEGVLSSTRVYSVS